MKLLYITNIPAPYRQKRFNTMAKVFPEYGINFEVLYMAKTEPNRKWVIPEGSYNYNYKIYKGIHPSIFGFFAHFNPGLLVRLLKNDYDIAIMGGMASPTHWLVPFFINKEKTRIMSVESNMYSVVRVKGLGAKFKSVLLKMADAFQVTGDPQIEYILFFHPEAKNKKFIRLPNLIDEDVFINQIDKLREKRNSLRQEFEVFPEEQMWVIPARLIHIKGIIPFIEALKGLSGFRLFLLGDGEQANRIQQIITSYKLPITLVGFVQQEQVIRYYAAADLFILPSFKDSSPLSPIEACAAGLPILISKQIGNINEVLGQHNGWQFEPGNQVEIKTIVTSILKMSLKDVNTKGIESRKQYLKNFETKTCVRSYARQILNMLNK